jgi:hypothetical protein
MHRYSDDAKWLRSIKLLEFRKPGNLLFTPGAPRSPKIKQKDLAMVTLELCDFARGILQGKIGGGFALTGSLEGGTNARLLTDRGLSYGQKQGRNNYQVPSN